MSTTKSEDFWFYVFLVGIVVGIVVGITAAVTGPDVDEWNNQDANGTCVTHHHIDSRIFQGKVSETYAVYCKKGK